MKSYLKSLTKTFYQKVQRVVEDEYIQPITQSQVYSILNRKRRNSIHLTKNQHSLLDKQNKQQQEILDNIERLSLVTPQRQFMLIGENYSIEVINYRMKQLRTKIEAVKQHMLSNYPNNLQAIETALLHLQEIKNLSLTREKAQLLREKIMQLQQIVNRTKKITRLNIKLKNIKQTLKIAEKIPNLKKMTLFDLKNINLSQINSFKQSIRDCYPLSLEKQLHCIKHMQFFIDKVASQQLRMIINSITDCLSLRFQGQQYEKAIKDFIISKSSIQYQKLLIRLIESQIRDKIQQEISNSQQRNQLLVRFRRYISILINISKLFRWHRYNLAVIDTSPQIQQKIRARTTSAISNCSQKSQDTYPIINLDSQSSIKINTEEIKLHTCGLMDQCLKEQVDEILFNDSIKNQEVFQLLVLINEFYQIAFSFSSYVFSESRNQIREILMRKCYKLQQKGMREFSQALIKEEQSQWNRLPVFRNYRYKSLQKSMEKIKRLHMYENVPKLTCRNFKFLNTEYNSQNQQSFQLEVAQRKQESFQLNQIDFPYDKLQKMLAFQLNDTQLPEHQDSQVVICKSSLTVLHYFDQFLSMYCYFPIEQIRNDILQKMSFYMDFFIYFLFETFLSSMYKKFFIDNHQNIQLNYLHIRVKTLYKELYQFLNSFNQRQNGSQLDGVNENGGRRRKESMEIAKYKSKGYSFIRTDVTVSRVSQENCVKARAIATDSIKFMLAYFEHVLGHLQRYTLQQTGQLNKKQSSQLSNYISRIQHYKTLQTQLSDLLLTDIVPVSTKIDFVLPLMRKIKWHQIQSSKQIGEYGSMMLKNIKQTYQKMRSMSKGEIPSYIIDRIFSFYWKTQLTFITKNFLQDHIASRQRGGRTAKVAFEKLVDYLYEGLMDFVGQKHKGKQSSGNKNFNPQYKNLNAQSNNQRVQLFRSVYMKVKKIFPILLQHQWENCREMLFNTIKEFQFIYKIQVCIMKASESCSGLSPAQIEYRQGEIDEFIRQKILQ